MKSKYEDLTGKHINRITFLEWEGLNDNRNSIWRVRCDCGVEFLALAINVKRGITKSCGCLRREMMIGNQRAKKAPTITGKAGAAQ